ncbi:MAG: nucleotidyl transferase AbiEii/AbiGii toxin family protein [Chloroflexi bacterium]|nr:nucleotidyl transferase AbiEii/AbiGii toxin family protein [Chloroflexota bacterium]
MIGEAELRRRAASWNVDPMVADLDYSLGWFIAALYEANRDTDSLYFKGGTCLRKCYFGDYRFSEDVDFTVTERLDSERLLDWIERAAHWAVEANGPDYRAAPVRFEIIRDEYGSETYQARVYYRGPLQWSGSPRAIRIDVTRNENVVLPPQRRCIIHPYSDEPALSRTKVTCYTLTEIMAEKIRAIGGQRRFAISRDLYDIHHLVQFGIVSADVIPLLSAKFEARDLDITALNARQIAARRSEFEDDWNRRLGYLVSAEHALDFEAAWETSMAVLQQIEEQL